MYSVKLKVPVKPFLSKLPLYPVIRKSLLNSTPASENVYGGYFASLNRDSGDPSDNGTVVDQNTRSYEAMRCWGSRSNGDGTGTFSIDFSLSASINPSDQTGLKPGSSIRRKALAGGAYTGDLGYIHRIYRIQQQLNQREN